MGLDLPGNGSSETMYETKSQNVAENGAVNLPEAGASTPYKRWSKCTMKKIGGKVFAGT